MRIRKILILLLALALLAGSAMAEINGVVDGTVTFEFKGKTYRLDHVDDGGTGYFLPITVMEPQYAEGGWMFEYTQEYSDYLKAEAAAENAWLAEYNADLGDESVPFFALSLVAVCALTGALYARRKRFAA